VRWSLPVGLVVLVALAVPGCSVAPAPDADRPLAVSSIPRRHLDPYRRLDEVVLQDAGTRWLVTPEAILEVADGFLNFEYTTEEGLLGTILSVDQSQNLLWVGTSEAIQTLDKHSHFIRTHLAERRLGCLYVDGYGPDLGVALTSLGVVLLDAPSLASEIYPLDDVDPRMITDVVRFDDYLWVATRAGLFRFSLSFKSWDQTFGSKGLRRAAVLRLELVEEENAPTTGIVTLYALSARGAFVYRPGFDSFDRIGL